MDKKTKPTYMLPSRDPFQIERYTQTKSKGMGKDILYKWKKKKQPRVVVLTSDKIDFKTKSLNRPKNRLQRKPHWKSYPTLSLTPLFYKNLLLIAQESYFTETWRTGKRI